jgi:predicted membrane protein
VVLVSIGRALYTLGMGMLVVYAVLIPLLGALSVLGVSLPSQLLDSMTVTGIGVSLVSGLTIIMQYLLFYRAIQPLDILKAGSLGLSFILGVVASAAVLIPINAVIDIYSSYAPQPIPAMLLALKATLITIVTTSITAYTVTRTLGAPLE